jgi:ABC-type branched-subunit amino acid transport system substrate-binding protein
MAGRVLCLIALVFSAAAQTPHKDARDHPPQYAGPGRDEPEPEGLSEILIGWFGPSDPQDAETGDIWLALNMAVQEANEDGGYHGLPYRLVPAWSRNQWGSGIGRVARLAYDDPVWAVLGSVDGASTHLAEQVVAKARLALVSPVSTDPTLTRAGVPWMFSCLPGDDRSMALLADEIARAGAPVTLLSATDHDSRVATVELLKVLSRRGATPDRHREFAPGTTDFAGLIEAARGTIVILAGPSDSARLLVALGNAGAGDRYLGGPALGRRAFAETAGAAADGVVFPLLCADDALTGPFARRFDERYGHAPDGFAVQAYDAARLLLAAIERSGLNRARIRDALEDLSPWQGEAGPISWDPLGQNQRPPRLATMGSELE